MSVEWCALVMSLCSVAVIPAMKLAYSDRPAVHAVGFAAFWMVIGLAAAMLATAVVVTVLGGN